MIYSAVEEHVLQAQYNGRQERNIRFLNSPLWCGRKDVLGVYINVHFGKKMRPNRQLWVVANPSPAPALTALNIFHAVKLETLIACIYLLILTALIILYCIINKVIYKITLFFF